MAGHRLACFRSDVGGASCLPNYSAELSAITGPAATLASSTDGGVAVASGAERSWSGSLRRNGRNIPKPPRRPSFGARVKECGDVARVAFADLKVGHGRPRRDVLRIANPLFYIGGIIGEVPADDHPDGDPIKRRADHAGGGAHVLERWAPAAAILDEHRLAAPWVPTRFNSGVHAHPVALLRIFVDDSDQRDDEEDRRQHAKSRVS